MGSGVRSATSYSSLLGFANALRDFLGLDPLPWSSKSVQHRGRTENELRRFYVGVHEEPKREKRL